jgi:nicotinamide-nucleotide amidase
LHAEIVTTGTELLLGVISDTNSTYIARQFRDIGLNLYYITSAGDNQERVAGVLNAALARSDVIITTGGLGPTVDDVTREAVAQATGRELELCLSLVESIETYFAKRGYTMTENNRRQARIPKGAIPIENPVGTAPCFIVEDERGVIISLPGVPREMEYLMTHVVIPYLREKFDLSQVIKSRTLRTCGIGESTLDSMIGDLERSSNPTVGLAAHPGQSDIRITAKADTIEQADAMLAEMESNLRARVDEVIFGVDDDTLEEVIVGLLRERDLSIAVGEVNSWGLVSSWLERADPPGTTFFGGWVLSTKHRWTLGADDTLSKDNKQEGLRLAHTVRNLSRADVGVAVVNNGLGDTYLVVVADENVYERTLRFRGYESHSQAWIASLTLDMVRRMCLGLPQLT